LGQSGHEQANKLAGSVKNDPQRKSLFSFKQFIVETAPDPLAKWSETVAQKVDTLAKPT
jgi:hypothetical protein